MSFEATPSEELAAEPVPSANSEAVEVSQVEGEPRFQENTSLPSTETVIVPPSTSVSTSGEASDKNIIEDHITALIQNIQPNRRSINRRYAVFNYIQKLLLRCLGSQQCTVTMFGSVPLRTFLPDGDIDLTALCAHGAPVQGWTDKLRAALDQEERNPHADFSVRDVQTIHAEVKLMKCLVGDIVVDISVNQLGGLCTLCFLEEVDRHIGRDNLFKRSIILVKAWCYYESRVLGAHHGLISTYALETLVLYILNVFHRTLSTPLQVLHRFLEFFSQFDWKTHCVSLQGPIPLASLPEMIPEPMEAEDGLLITEEVLNAMVGQYQPHYGSGYAANGQRPFVRKHLNVVDPLLPSNNVGRSVSQSNLLRIKRAFAHGAAKLTKALHRESAEEAVEDLNKFFCNTRRSARDKAGGSPDEAGALDRAPADPPPSMLAPSPMPEGPVLPPSQIDFTPPLPSMPPSGPPKPPPLPPMPPPSYHRMNNQPLPMPPPNNFTSSAAPAYPMLLPTQPTTSALPYMNPSIVYMQQRPFMPTSQPHGPSIPPGPFPRHPRGYMWTNFAARLSQAGGDVGSYLASNTPGSQSSDAEGSRPRSNTVPLTIDKSYKKPPLPAGAPPVDACTLVHSPNSANHPAPPSEAGESASTLSSPTNQHCEGTGVSRDPSDLLRQSRVDNLADSQTLTDHSAHSTRGASSASEDIQVSLASIGDGVRLVLNVERASSDANEERGVAEPTQLMQEDKSTASAGVQVPAADELAESDADLPSQLWQEGFGRGSAGEGVRSAEEGGAYEGAAAQGSGEDAQTQLQPPQPERPGIGGVPAVPLQVFIPPVPPGGDPFPLLHSSPTDFQSGPAEEGPFALHSSRQPSQPPTYAVPEPPQEPLLKPVDMLLYRPQQPSSQGAGGSATTDGAAAGSGCSNSEAETWGGGIHTTDVVGGVDVRETDTPTSGPKGGGGTPSSEAAPRLQPARPPTEGVSLPPLQEVYPKLSVSPSPKAGQATAEGYGSSFKEAAMDDAAPAATADPTSLDHAAAPDACTATLPVLIAPMHITEAKDSSPLDTPVADGAFGFHSDHTPGLAASGPRGLPAPMPPPPLPFMDGVALPKFAESVNPLLPSDTNQTLPFFPLPLVPSEAPAVPMHANGVAGESEGESSAGASGVEGEARTGERGEGTVQAVARAAASTRHVRTSSAGCADLVPAGPTTSLAPHLRLDDDHGNDLYSEKLAAMHSRTHSDSELVFRSKTLCGDASEREPNAEVKGASSKDPAGEGRAAGAKQAAGACGADEAALPGLDTADPLARAADAAGGSAPSSADAGEDVGSILTGELDVHQTNLAIARQRRQQQYARGPRSPQGPASEAGTWMPTFQGSKPRMGAKGAGLGPPYPVMMDGSPVAQPMPPFPQGTGPPLPPDLGSDHLPRSARERPLMHSRLTSSDASSSMHLRSTPRMPYTGEESRAPFSSRAPGGGGPISGGWHRLAAAATDQRRLMERRAAYNSTSYSALTGGLKMGNMTASSEMPAWGLGGREAGGVGLGVAASGSEQDDAEAEGDADKASAPEDGQGHAGQSGSLGGVAAVGGETGMGGEGGAEEAQQEGAQPPAPAPPPPTVCGLDFGGPGPIPHVRGNATPAAASGGGTGGRMRGPGDSHMRRGAGGGAGSDGPDMAAMGQRMRGMEGSSSEQGGAGGGGPPWGVGRGPAVGRRQDRQEYTMKDDDFPPLGGPSPAEPKSPSGWGAGWRRKGAT